VDKLDRNEDWLAWLAFIYGVNDLKTGEFMELKPEMMISKTIGYPFPRQAVVHHEHLIDLFILEFLTVPKFIPTTGSAIAFWHSGVGSQED
jgi:hypothetical protein